jgi:hypothetical protein
MAEAVLCRSLLIWALLVYAPAPHALALVFLGDEATAEAALTREAARLRKRFQLLKEQLKKRWSQ